MKCIDFDKKFEYVVTEWVKKHAKEYRNYDEMEAHIPEVYDTFLDTPADWLSGVKPGEYFEQFDNAKQLVNWLEDYEKQRVPVPDMLMNRIADLGKQSEEPLMNLLTKEKTAQAARMDAISLLNEIDSVAPADLYLSWIKNYDSKNELHESALDSLDVMGSMIADKMLALLPECNEEGQIALLSILCKNSKDESLVDLALKLIKTHPESCAILAAVLSDLGSERAIEPLKKIAASEETGYLDYIELRNAIEALGGDAPEREFDSEDPEYSTMRTLEEKMVAREMERRGEN